MKTKLSVRERARLSKDLAADASLLFQRLEASNAALVGAGKTIRKLKRIAWGALCLGTTIGALVVRVLT
jgi:hypothetical protein